MQAYHRRRARARHAAHLRDIDADALGFAQNEIADRIIAALKQFNLPTVVPRTLARSAIIDALMRDKKFEEGKVRFVLLPKIGDAFVSKDVPIEAIVDAVLTLYGP